MSRLLIVNNEAFSAVYQAWQKEGAPGTLETFSSNLITNALTWMATSAEIPYTEPQPEAGVPLVVEAQPDTPAPTPNGGTSKVDKLLADLDRHQATQVT